MKQKFWLLYILLLLDLFSLYTAKAFPQYTKQEDTDEDTDDIYDEEDNGSSTTEAEEEEENEEDHTPVDKDELEDAIARKKLAERLGVKNFSSAAIAEKASNYVVSYLTGGFLRPPTPKPRRRIKPATNPKIITTKKYKIYKNSTNSPNLKPVNLAGNSTALNTRTFVINVPHGMNGTGGGTIEINIPMEAMQNSEDEAHASQMTISAPDDQNVKNIEAAIMEALIIAQQMTGMSMMANASVNGTEVFELDISKNMIQNLTEIRTIPEETTNITIAQQEIEAPEISTTEIPEIKPTKRRRRRTTTLAPDDVLAVGPATGVIVSQIRSGQLPTFLWKSIIKLASSKYMQIAVDAVECAVFYECPNDAELGTLTKGAKF